MYESSSASEISKVLGGFHHTDKQLLWRIMGHLQEDHLIFDEICQI